MSCGRSLPWPAVVVTDPAVLAHLLGSFPQGLVPSFCVSSVMTDLGSLSVSRIISLFNSLIWPLQNSDGPWKMPVNHSKVHQVVVLTADVAPFLEYINMCSGTWYVAIDLVNVFLFLFLPYQKRSEFTFT